jgi:uncharacterized Zn finger protein
MEYECPSCKSSKYSTEKIEIAYTQEVVTVKKCTNCGIVIDANIERPKGMALKRKHGAGEIRFSENEKRKFASIVLSMLDTQIKLLEAIATKADEEEVKKIINGQKAGQTVYEYLIGEDDDSCPPDIDY